jgi:KDO2-lipid IV(A) lauroyltransferase
VVLTNLRLCFPELSEAERRALAREHFALAGRSLVERGLAWFAPEERIRRLVRIEGEEPAR